MRIPGLALQGHLLRTILPSVLSAVLLLYTLAVTPALAQVDCTGALSGEGEATYYNYEPGLGNCSFVGDDSDPMVAAMNAVDYAGSQMCGRWVRVTGPLGSVDVRIVDRCPVCPVGDIDLNQAAFEQIANLPDGRVPITWETIPDPNPGNASIYVALGSNPWYVQFQARSHRYGISSIEYLGPSGYVGLPRETWNVFVLDSSSGLVGPYDDPCTVRVTDVHGQSVVVTDVSLTSGGTTTSSVQFPPCAPATATPPGIAARGVILHEAMPNPFNPSTELSFSIPGPGAAHARLEIYDRAGRLVTRLLDEIREPGEYTARWTGVDTAGRGVVSGVYFARLQVAGYVEQTRKLALIK